jgi:hypothetical protein
MSPQHGTEDFLVRCCRWSHAGMGAVIHRDLEHFVLKPLLIVMRLFFSLTINKVML